MRRRLCTESRWRRLRYASGSWGIGGYLFTEYSKMECKMNQNQDSPDYADSPEDIFGCVARQNRGAPCGPDVRRRMWYRSSVAPRMFHTSKYRSLTKEAAYRCTFFVLPQRKYQRKGKSHEFPPNICVHYAGTNRNSPRCKGRNVAQTTIRAFLLR